MATSTALERVTRERGVAREAAQAKLEELRATAFDQVFIRYDAQPGNDPDPLTGPSPGAHFDVEGLRPRPDDPDGRVGEILFPVTGTPTTPALIYAPHSRIAIQTMFEIYGSVMARQVALGSNSSIHYDTSLLFDDDNGPPEFEKVSWRPIGLE